jgi:hypothetical protein
MSDASEVKWSGMGKGDLDRPGGVEGKRERDESGCVRKKTVIEKWEESGE